MQAQRNKVKINFFAKRQKMKGENTVLAFEVRHIKDHAFLEAFVILPCNYHL